MTLTFVLKAPLTKFNHSHTFETMNIETFIFDTLPNSFQMTLTYTKKMAIFDFVSACVSQTNLVTVFFFLLLRIFLLYTWSWRINVNVGIKCRLITVTYLNTCKFWLELNFIINDGRTIDGGYLYISCCFYKSNDFILCNILYTFVGLCSSQIIFCNIMKGYHNTVKDNF